ncbi:MAG: EpsI family protein [Candidatus Hydrogenedentes bacterium]|nr:EpsI family protein [Candidatus Hydrogenedentota bacterium]
MKHYIIGIVAMALTATLHLGITHAQDRAAMSSLKNPNLNLPARIGQYRQIGEDIDPGDEVRRILETSSILMRHYVTPSGLPVLVTVVYAGQKRRSLHFPEVCLVGQGWEVERAYAAPVGMEFRAKRLVIFQGNRKEAILYWFKTGDTFTGSSFVNALLWGREQLRFGTPTSTMIKLSMPVTAAGIQGEDQAFAALDDLALRMAPFLRENIK